MTERRIPLDTNAIRAALELKIQTLENCICAYVREEPYHLERRIINPECTAHTPEDDGELEKERG